MSSALGGALGMSSTYTWTQVVSAITGVANRGGYSRTFTPTTSYQSASSGAGYYSSVSVACNAVSLSGNAGTGQVLSGYTFYNNSLTRQTGTMANRGNLNWSGSNTTYSVPAGYYSGGTLDSRTSYNNGYNAGVSAGTSNARNLKSATYSVTSEATSIKANDTNGTQHNVWRVPISCITSAHRIVSAYWNETSGNQYKFIMNAQGYTMAGPNNYIIPMTNISGNGSDWATKTYGTIYLVCEHASRGCAITIHYI